MQRRLSRKVTGASNGQKARLRVTKAHATVADKRLDSLHKLGTRLMRENQGIYMEGLPVAGMGNGEGLVAVQG